jgi:hypothetical protein
LAKQRDDAKAAAASAPMPPAKPRKQKDMLAFKEAVATIEKRGDRKEAVEHLSKRVALIARHFDAVGPSAAVFLKAAYDVRARGGEDVSNEAASEWAQNRAGELLEVLRGVGELVGVKSDTRLLEVKPKTHKPQPKTRN